MYRRLAAALSSVVAVSLLVATPVSAAPSVFPDQITLPSGFRPEGIASGRGTTFYVGSIPTGAVRVGDFRTRETSPLVPGGPGRAAIGVEEAGGVLYVAGGPTGKAFLYDARTGGDIAQLTLRTGPTFINDVVVTQDAAYFTDSVNPFVYRVDRRTLEVTAIPLTGDIVYGTGNNVNGIDATPNGDTLVVVQSNTGKLFTVDPRSGVTREIDLGGATVVNGDGILLAGRRLYVVQNRLNRIATVRLSPDLTSGTVESLTTDPAFDVPTTIARFGSRLYAVNARFGTQSPSTAEYSVVGVDLPSRRR